MNDKKYAIIIDSHPSTDEKKKRLISNLENLKKQNIDVVLTSRYPCPPEIISKADHFVYQSDQKFYYLDSDILDYMSCENLEPITPYYLWRDFGNEKVIDKLVNTQWCISIVSAMQSAIQLLWAKGYNYGFYLLDDFICPDDMSIKIKNIFEKCNGHRNYFIKNGYIDFSGYYSPWFFGFTIDQNLIKKIPRENLNQNEIFQKYYPNCAHEDFINRIWSSENNYIEEREHLDKIFGKDNWDCDKLNVSKLPNNLYVNTTSSVFIKKTDEEIFYTLYLSLGVQSNFEKAHFYIQFKNENNQILRNLDMEIIAGNYYAESVKGLFETNNNVYLTKKVIGFGESESFFEETITFNKEKMDCYAKLKYYE
ncbi:hypothetical protein EBU71_03955 [bacterium]|nr:hypothetical protein [Candidatus Elulimicrobium humile]